MRIPMFAVLLVLASTASYADPLTCNLAAYKATAGGVYTPGVLDVDYTVAFNTDSESVSGSGVM